MELEIVGLLCLHFWGMLGGLLRSICRGIRSSVGSALLRDVALGRRLVARPARRCVSGGVSCPGRIPVRLPWMTQAARPSQFRVGELSGMCGLKMAFENAVSSKKSFSDGKVCPSMGSNCSSKIGESGNCIVGRTITGDNWLVERKGGFQRPVIDHDQRPIGVPSRHSPDIPTRTRIGPNL
jgi:hypothetical protein